MFERSCQQLERWERAGLTEFCVSCNFDRLTIGNSNFSDRIIEIAYLKVFPNGDEESRKMRINPEMPIPAKITELTTITDDMVQDALSIKDIKA